MTTMPAGMAPDLPYSGRIADGRHLFAIRIYYEDTDAGGIVYHASYLRFLERARTDMLALCGIDLAAAAATTGHFVVADAALRFVRPALLGDALLVESRLVELRAASCVVQQNVRRDGQGVVDGRLRIAFVSREGRPRRLPAEWIRALSAVNGVCPAA